jgi:hypothetical protein
MDTDAQLAQYFAGMWPHLDEHARRLMAASHAVELALTSNDPGLAPALDGVVEPTARATRSRRRAGPARVPARWRRNGRPGATR